MRLLGHILTSLIGCFSLMTTIKALSTCPEMCRCIPVEQTVDCSNSSLTSVPNGIARNTRILILSHNSLSSLSPNDFRGFGKRLEVLKLSNNALETLDGSWLRGLKKLRELDLSSNNLYRIELLAFNSSANLQVLKLKNNQLSILPDGAFWGLEALKKLHLDDNQIECVRLNWTFGLSNLQELRIKRNALQNISKGSFEPMKNLSKLYLNENYLHRLEEGVFDGLKNLEILRLDNNKIEFVDEKIFQKMDSLEMLDLSNNILSWSLERTRGIFARLNNLKRLKLNNNRIRVLHSNTFDGIHTLKELDLSNNPLTTIESEAFSSLTSLEELNLNSSSLFCDCSIKSFVDWLKSNQTYRKFAKTVHCSFPKFLHDKTQKNIFDAKSNDYDCQDRRRPILMDNFKAFDRPLQAIKHKNIAFYCKIASSVSVKFSWIKDNELIENFENQSRIVSKTLSVQNSDNSTLHTNILSLSNVQDDDEGQYQCVGSNGFGVVYSHSFRVNVFVVPQFLKRPSNVTAKIGSTVRWNCSAFGQPQPQVTWNKAGKFVAGGERRLRFDGDLFFIINVTKEDAGIYTFSALNEAGVNVSTVSLKVVQPAKLVRTSPDLITTELDTPASLECIAVGLPTPTIQWFRNGTFLERTNRHFFTHQDQFLLIVNLREEDAGKYSCQAKNEFGIEEVEFNLKPIPKRILENISQEFNIYSFIKKNTLYICGAVLIILLTSIAWLTLFICYQGKQNKTNVKNNIINEAQKELLKKNKHHTSIDKAQVIETQIIHNDEHNDEQYEERTISPDSGMESNRSNQATNILSNSYDQASSRENFLHHHHLHHPRLHNNQSYNIPQSIMGNLTLTKQYYQGISHSPYQQNSTDDIIRYATIRSDNRYARIRQANFNHKLISQNIFEKYHLQNIPKNSFSQSKSYKQQSHIPKLHSQEQIETDL